MWFIRAYSTQCLLSTALWIQSLFMVSLATLLLAALNFLHGGQYFFTFRLDDTCLEGKCLKQGFSSSTEMPEWKMLPNLVLCYF